jgi:hypothetical protein
MGTRSVTIILDGNQELVRFYRQFDGYPSGHGVELAKAANKTICNGIGSGMSEKTHANGMGCLAAQIITSLKSKHGIGGIYIEPPGGEIGEWIEYVYTVRSAGVGRKPTIDCSTQTGPWPFNAQEEAKHIFTLQPEQVIAKYDENPAALLGKKPRKKKTA